MPFPLRPYFRIGPRRAGGRAACGARRRRTLQAPGERHHGVCGFSGQTAAEQTKSDCAGIFHEARRPGPVSVRRSDLCGVAAQHPQGSGRHQTRLPGDHSRRLPHAQIHRRLHGRSQDARAVHRAGHERHGGHGLSDPPVQGHLPRAADHGHDHHGPAGADHAAARGRGGQLSAQTPQQQRADRKNGPDPARAGGDPAVAGQSCTTWAARP